jgi:hypothetical protein
MFSSCKVVAKTQEINFAPIKKDYASAQMNSLFISQLFSPLIVKNMLDIFSSMVYS